MVASESVENRRQGSYRVVYTWIDQLRRDAVVWSLVSIRASLRRVSRSSFEITYDRVKEFYASSRFAYFTKARRVVDELGLTGPIVWSNLAKCENARGQKELPPIQTMRHCYGRFLRRELETIPREWPALALGRDVFLALAYLVPERAVIGIPHPTGARSFHTLFKQDGTLRDDLRDRAADALSAPELGAVWLGLRKERA